jgi:hypothetical protein
VMALSLLMASSLVAGTLSRAGRAAAPGVHRPVDTGGLSGSRQRYQAWYRVTKPERIR